MNILIAGDFCPQARVKKLCEEGKFAEVLGDARSIVEKADFSIVNFECPVTQGNEHPIEKKGPNLRCSEKGVEAIKWAGFCCVTLANNHFLDFGSEGVHNTLEACKKHDIETVGGGMNIKEASQTLYKQIDGKTLAVINCCEHEFSIATATTPGANPLNPVQQYYAIKEARTQADYVLVIIHGGHEHWQLPSTRMQETYRFFIDAGADAVVNHHQHCFSGYEVYKGKPIFYGLGNFCFDNPKKRNNIWNEGYLVELIFSMSKTGFVIHPYNQCDENAKIMMLPLNEYEVRITELNSIITDNTRLIKITEQYYNKCMKSIAILFEPVTNKYILAAQKRGWLPSFLPKKQKTKLQNHILCESHKDKLKYYFENVL